MSTSALVCGVKLHLLLKLPERSFLSTTDLGHVWLTGLIAEVHVPREPRTVPAGCMPNWRSVTIGAGLLCFRLHP
jgi:hypothetical protein